jgi:hypothetical protein
MHTGIEVDTQSFGVREGLLGASLPGRNRRRKMQLTTDRHIGIWSSSIEVRERRSFPGVSPGT